MEPITWGWIATTVLSGIVGNRADAGFLQACSAGWQQATRRWGAPKLTDADAEVALALNRAFLWAQQSLVDECLHGATGGTYGGVSAHVSLPGREAEVEWLIAQAKRLKTELKQLEAGKLEPLAQAEVTVLEGLLQQQDAEGYLHHQLVAVVQQGNPPPAYQTLALSQDRGLLPRIAAYFEFELKINPSLQAWFERELLMHINQQLKTGAISPLAWTDLQEVLHQVVQQVPDVIRRIDNVALALADVDQDMANLGGLVNNRFDELMSLASQHADDLVSLKQWIGQLVIELQAQTQPPTLSPVGTVVVVRDRPNPFICGPAVPPDKFFGRQLVMRDIKNRIGSVVPQSINIVGLRRSGKSSMLRYIKERITHFCVPEQNALVVSLDLQDRRFHTPVGIMEGLRRGIAKQTGGEPWQQAANEDAFEVQDGLENLREQGYRLIVLFDEFEAIGQRLEQFQGWGEDWRAKASASLVTLMVASRRPLSEIYQTLQLTSPFGNLFSTTYLGSLEPEAVQQLLAQGEFGWDEQRWITAVAGYLPYYVQLAAAMVWQSGRLDDAQIEFNQQARPRFQELWSELTEPEKISLRQVVGGALPPSFMPVVEVLKLYGLLCPHGQIGSDAFAAFVQERQ